MAEAKSYKVSINTDDDIIHIELDHGYVNLKLPWLLQSLKDCGYKITPPPSLLYTQAKEYLATIWSKDCFEHDDGILLKADNGNRYINLCVAAGSTPFLELYLGNYRVFDGYIRGIEDFKLLLELTSVRKTT